MTINKPQPNAIEYPTPWVVANPDPKLFESKPRFRDAPPICLKTNLLAYISRAVLDKFVFHTCPSCPAKKVWTCEHCKLLHAEHGVPNPAGDSSGKGRSTKTAEDNELRAERLAAEAGKPPLKKVAKSDEQPQPRQGQKTKSRQKEM